MGHWSLEGPPLPALLCGCWTNFTPQVKVTNLSPVFYPFHLVIKLKCVWRQEGRRGNTMAIQTKSTQPLCACTCTKRRERWATIQISCTSNSKTKTVSASDNHEGRTSHCVKSACESNLEVRMKWKKKQPPQLWGFLHVTRQEVDVFKNMRQPQSDKQQSPQILLSSQTHKGRAEDK